MEVWKDIKGFEGKYQISNYGKVKSLSRLRDTKRIIGKKYYYDKVYSKEKILTPIIKSIGYIQYTLRKQGKSKIVLAHRIVAEHFIENPFNKPQINHKDGNGLNNIIENLEWCNASENGLHSYKVLKNKTWIKGKTSKNHPTSRAILQKTLDNKLVKKWECGLDAVRQGGFDSGCICRCCKNENKFHKGFIWEYE